MAAGCVYPAGCEDTPGSYSGCSLGFSDSPSKPCRWPRQRVPAIRRSRPGCGKQPGLTLVCALNHQGSNSMVRLVFRPYTQVRKAICTSAHLRASTWVSPSFALLRHSSPSFGSQHTYSDSILSQKLMVGRECGLRPAPHQFLCASWVCSPPARTHVALLGPCFKTGASEAFRRHHGDAVPEGLGRPDTSARLATA